MACDRMESKADKMPNWLSFYFPKVCHFEDRTDQPPTEPDLDMSLIL